jgi:hypothetical protein
MSYFVVHIGLRLGVMGEMQTASFGCNAMVRRSATTIGRTTMLALATGQCEMLDVDGRALMVGLERTWIEDIPGEDYRIPLKLGLSTRSDYACPSQYLNCEAVGGEECSEMAYPMGWQNGCALLGTGLVCGCGNVTDAGTMASDYLWVYKLSPYEARGLVRLADGTSPMGTFLGKYIEKQQIKEGQCVFKNWHWTRGQAMCTEVAWGNHTLQAGYQGFDFPEELSMGGQMGFDLRTDSHGWLVVGFLGDRWQGRILHQDPYTHLKAPMEKNGKLLNQADVLVWDRPTIEGIKVDLLSDLRGSLNQALVTTEETRVHIEVNGSQLTLLGADVEARAIGWVAPEKAASRSDACTGIKLDSQERKGKYGMFSVSSSSGCRAQVRGHHCWVTPQEMIVGPDPSIIKASCPMGGTIVVGDLTIEVDKTLVGDLTHGFKAFSSYTRAVVSGSWFDRIGFRETFGKVENKGLDISVMAVGVGLLVMSPSMLGSTLGAILVAGSVGKLYAEGAPIRNSRPGSVPPTPIDWTIEIDGHVAGWGARANGYGLKEGTVSRDAKVRKTRPRHGRQVSRRYKRQVLHELRRGTAVSTSAERGAAEAPKALGQPTGYEYATGLVEEYGLNAFVISYGLYGMVKAPKVKGILPGGYELRVMGAGIALLTSWTAYAEGSITYDDSERLVGDLAFPEKDAVSNLHDARSLYVAGFEEVDGTWSFVLGNLKRYEWDNRLGIRFNPYKYYSSWKGDTMVNYDGVPVGAHLVILTHVPGKYSSETIQAQYKDHVTTRATLKGYDLTTYVRQNLTIALTSLDDWRIYGFSNEGRPKGVTTTTRTECRVTWAGSGRETTHTKEEVDRTREMLKNYDRIARDRKLRILFVTDFAHYPAVGSLKYVEVRGARVAIGSENWWVLKPQLTSFATTDTACLN